MSEQSGEVRNWRRIALPVSLVLNLFLVALIGGHVLRVRANEASAAMPPIARALANAEASLSAADAAAFGAAMHRDGPHSAEEAQRLSQARAELERQVMAEPYDPLATRQALTAWLVSWNQYVDGMGDTLVDALGRISPEGRRKLVAARRKARVGFLAH